jgi:hypothetical protein
MSMPGFTADASLYQSDRQYPTVTTSIASLDAVVPQFYWCSPDHVLHDCGPWWWGHLRCKSLEASC